MVANISQIQTVLDFMVDKNLIFELCIIQYNIIISRLIRSSKMVSPQHIVQLKLYYTFHTYPI
jgi:hypothetical protein